MRGVKLLVLRLLLVLLVWWQGARLLPAHEGGERWGLQLGGLRGKAGGPQACVMAQGAQQCVELHLQRQFHPLGHCVRQVSNCPPVCDAGATVPHSL